MCDLCTNPPCMPEHCNLNNGCLMFQCHSPQKRLTALGTEIQIYQLTVQVFRVTGKVHNVSNLAIRHISLYINMCMQERVICLFPSSKVACLGDIKHSGTYYQVQGGGGLWICMDPGKTLLLDVAQKFDHFPPGCPMEQGISCCLMRKTRSVINRRVTFRFELTMTMSLKYNIIDEQETATNHDRQHCPSQ